MDCQKSQYWQTNTKDSISDKLITKFHNPQYNTLLEIKSKLQTILQALYTQYQELKIKHEEEEKRLLKQIQDKDRLILSLTKINNGLLEENRKMKGKLDEQIQYFAKRVTETEVKALEQKKKLEDNLTKYQAIFKKLIEQYGQKNIENKMPQLKDIQNALQKFNIRNNNIRTDIENRIKNKQKSNIQLNKRNIIKPAVIQKLKNINKQKADIQTDYLNRINSNKYFSPYKQKYLENIKTNNQINL